MEVIARWCDLRAEIEGRGLVADDDAIDIRPWSDEVVAPASRADLAWMDAGRCREEHVEFFPERGQRAGPARVVCQGCVVRELCLAYAIRHEIVDGVWGGLGAQERVELIERRRRERRRGRRRLT